MLATWSLRDERAVRITLLAFILSILQNLITFLYAKRAKGMVVVEEQERQTDSDSDVFVLPPLFVVDETNNRVRVQMTGSTTFLLWTVCKARANSPQKEGC